MTDPIARTVVDIVAREAATRLEQVVQDLTARAQRDADAAARQVQDAVDGAMLDVGPRLDELVRESANRLGVPGALDPREPVEIEVPPSPATAATRTIGQGAAAVFITTMLGAIVAAVGRDDFQLLDWGSWQGTLSGAGIAGTMAVLAWFQRRKGW